MTKNTDILAAGNPAESFRGYASLLRNIKQRVQIGQQRAIYAANEEMSGDDYYIDILMYNAFLHRYMVIELKDTEFMPEYIGKLNFYCSAVDDILCREGDNRTIGLLLCRTKDRIKAEYALRDIQKPIGISDYELGQALPKDFRGSLPTIEEIERALEADN